MSHPKTAPQLTRAGTPRKRAKGAGRPSAGRTANLPRIKPAHHAQLVSMAHRNGQTVAGQLEQLIEGEAQSQ